MVNIIFLYFGKILQRLSGCMSLDFLITVPHGCVFIRCRVSVYQSITSYVRLLLFCFFFVLGCRYPGQSPEGLQLRWCFLLFRLLVIDHVYNRVKHGNVTQLDTVPVDDLFLTVFYLAY